MKKMIPKICNSIKSIYHFQREADIQKMLFAELILQQRKNRESEFINNIHASEFRVFSQWNDDGIIQFLINYLEINDSRFIEFGVEDYKEANTRFLLQHDNWKGLIMDGSQKNIRSIHADDIYWRHDITAIHAWITPENINALLEQNQFTGDIGLLHIDVDGPDYWIWKAISVVTPVIVIVEYDHLLGHDQPLVPQQHEKHNSIGSSLLSLCDLAEEKGYAFIGCESHGVNAYFVRKDKTRDLRRLSASEGFRRSSANSSRKQISLHAINTRTSERILD